MADVWEPVNGVFTASASWLSWPAFLDKFEWFPFFMATVGALAGAWFGARAAQKFAKSSRSEDELIKEIRSCNLGISLAIYTFEIVRSLNEIVHPLHTNYLRALRDHLDAQSKGGRLANPRYELEGFSVVTPPIDALRKIVYEDITASTNALRAMPSLEHALESAKTAIEARNNLLENFRHKRFPDGFDLYGMYFGAIVGEEAHRDYPDTVKHLGDATNEMLFFSELLCIELHRHACALREQHREFSKAPVTIRMLRLRGEAESYQAALREKYGAWFDATLPVEETERSSWWQFWRK